MKAGIVRIGAALACVVVGAACPDDPGDRVKTAVVARVGDDEIRESHVLAALAQHGTVRVADPAARLTVARTILDDMITERLLLQAAHKSGITIRDDEVDREVRSRAEGYPAGIFQRLLSAEQLTLTEFREKVRNRLVQDAFLRARLAAAPAITDDEVKARFESTEKAKPAAEQVHARQILVKTSEEANHILDQLRAKKVTFEAAAQRFSTAPDAETGGDLGWFGKGDMPSTFDICFALPKGTISDVVISDYGFHIFQVVDFREQHVETLDAARPRIEAEIMREHQDAAYQKLLEELRTTTKIEVSGDVLQALVTRLPAAPVTPAEAPPQEHEGSPLDSLPAAADPIPPRRGAQQ